MDITIKSEPNSLSPCIACLRNDGQMFGEHEIREEIVIIYKLIVKDHIKHVETIEICIECMETLNDITDFQQKCINSLQIFSNGLKLEEEEQLPENILNVEIKVEDNPLDDVLKLESDPEEVSEEPEEEHEQKIVEKPQKKKQVRPSKSKTIEAFCPVCCNSHPDCHKHVVDIHSRGIEADGSVNCLLCNHICRNIDTLLSHLETHSEFDQPKKCGRCEFYSKDRYEFLQHVQKTHFQQRKRFYTCDFCDSVFYQSINLKYHTRSHLGGLKCNYCEKCYFDRKVYEEHIEMHKKRLAQIKFTCDYCGYVAQFKPSLKKHMLHHHTSSDQNVMCHICNKTYKAKFQLTKHLYNAHKEKKLPCSYCGRMFGLGNVLTKHISTVHMMNSEEKRQLRAKEKPKVRKHSCDECDMKFYQLGSLRKHKHMHSKTRPFNCNICKSGYYTNIYLRKHFLREHGIVYTPKEIRKICGIKFNEDSD